METPGFVYRFTAGAVNYYIMLADITPWNILEGSRIFYNE